MTAPEPTPVTVPPGVLSDHAANLDRIASGLWLTHDAARVTHLDRGAYGQLCQFMVVVFEPSMHLTVGGLAMSADTIERLARSLRGTDRGFDDADAAAVLGTGVPLIRLPL